MKDSIRNFLSTFLHDIVREIETTKTVSSITNLKIQRYRDFLYDKNYILQDGQHLKNYINLFDIQGLYHNINIHNVIYRIIHYDIKQLTDFFNEQIVLFDQLKEYMEHEEDEHVNENDEENVKGYVFK
jgi:hypothetical protein